MGEWFGDLNGHLSRGWLFPIPFGSDDDDDDDFGCIVPYTCLNLIVVPAFF